MYLGFLDYQYMLLQLPPVLYSNIPPPSVMAMSQMAASEQPPGALHLHLEIRPVPDEPL